MLRGFDYTVTGEFLEDDRLGEGLNLFIETNNQLLLAISGLLVTDFLLTEEKIDTIQRLVDNSLKKLDEIREEYKGDYIVNGAGDREKVKRLKSSLKEVLDDISEMRKSLYEESKQGEISEIEFGAYDSVFDLLSNFLGDILLDCQTGSDAIINTPFNKFDFTFYLDYTENKVNALIKEKREEVVERRL